jgi:exodeoxyribonuclease-3
MRVVSWNVNGIRACLDKGLPGVAKEFGADYLCLQESKACENQVPWNGHAELAGYQSVWASAEKKGYSGTVIFTPHREVELASTMGIPLYDREGRTTLAYGPGFTIVNLYIPNGAASDERHHFKMKYLEDLLGWLKKLEAKRGPLIICGDYNIAHAEIDIHDPKGNKDSSGFRPEERAWMTKFLAAGFVDTFRHLNPERKDQYSWWSFRQRSRERNKGWRIDYICISKALLPALQNAAIHPAILGSDHCPVSIDLSL